MFMFKYRLEWILKLGLFRLVRGLVILLALFVAACTLISWCTNDKTYNNKEVNAVHTVVQEQLNPSLRKDSDNTQLTQQQVNYVNQGFQAQAQQNKEAKAQQKEQAQQIFHVQGAPANQQPIQ